MSSFPLPDVALSDDDYARVVSAVGDTSVLWLEQIAADPIGAMEQGGLSGKPLIVGDAATLAALGADWKELPTFIIPDDMDATQYLANKLRIETRKVDYLVAVGTGTINDLCKYAAAHEDRRYGVIPTAPTMNGFVSSNASITVDGLKQSMKAAMPKVVACDADLLARSPKHMQAAGFGDAICRFTAQTDWYMSHLVMETPYDPLPFLMQAPLDKQLALAAGALGRGNKEATKILMESLLMSGLGMVIAGGSMPASQGEHLIAHTLDRIPAIATSRLNKVLHGEQIAITTLSMALLQRAWLDSPAERWLIGDWKRRARDKYWNSASKIAGYYGLDQAPTVYKEFTSKLPNDRGFEQLLERFGSQWNAIRSRIQSQVPRWSPRQLHQMLLAVGAPTELGQVGWHRARYDGALRHAHFYRGRWTFLDLAYFFGPNQN